jgi:MICOS complex subunit MIC10
MPETSIAPPSAPVSRPAKPVSEALLNEKVCYTCSQLLFYSGAGAGKASNGCREGGLG